MAKEQARPQETIASPSSQETSPATEALEPGDLATESNDAPGALARPPARIGSYRILRELGHGGMGAVYLAARADDEYEKKVAIKVILGGGHRKDVVRHFRRERQILAGLDHPNIARLLDGGTTEDGLPYLVMEYIEGEPIHKYCDGKNLSTVERLRLFLGVCAAVQHAHRSLVVHRDIKPGNILVSADGVPRLLDFGIAKLLETENTGESATATSLAMTPAYASPEQVRGEAITTASDVYSLGVLLYEILTGHPPYRLKSLAPVDVLRAVVDQEAERPSAAVDRTEQWPGSDGTLRVLLDAETVSRTRESSPERLRLRLKGDLDNILLLALRKEPGLRYASVEAFAADLRRYLEGRPVSARKGTWWYRAGKFASRNMWSVAAAAAVALAISASVVNVMVQSRRVARERDKAERVAAFLVELFAVSDPGEARGNSVTAREMLDKGSERIRTELKDQPDVRATLMATMSRVYDSLGLYDRSIELAEEALAVRRKTFGSASAEAATSLNDLGNVLSDKGDLPRAEAAYREALELRRKTIGPESREVSEVLNNLAGVLAARGDNAAAEASFRESLALKRRLLGPEDRTVANTLRNLAVVTYNRGDYSGSEALVLEALAIQRKTLGPDHPAVADSLGMLAVLADSKGDYAGAEARYREALTLQTRLLGEDHPEVATTSSNLANTLVRRGDFAAAVPLYEKAVAVHRRVGGEESTDVAADLLGLATVAAGTGDFAREEDLVRQAVAMRKRALGADHADVGQGLIGLAAALRDRAKLAEAETTARQGLALVEAKLPPDHPARADGLLVLSAVLSDRGMWAEAERVARQALELRKQAPEESRWRAAEAESLLGAALSAQGRRAEGEPLLVASHAVLEKRMGPRSRETRDALARLRAAQQH